MRHLLRLTLCVAFAFAGVRANAQSLSASPSSVTTGQGVSATLTAAWSSISAPTNTDWIALYRVGAADNAFISYRYTTGTASGDMPYTIPSTVAAGTYELRLFSNNVYTLLATSGSFTVTNPSPANLSESPSSLYAGLSVAASWSTIYSPTATDWIALYPVGAADNAFIAWRYTDGSAAGSAPLTIPANAAAGSYELRLFKNNVYTLLATSGSFTVQTPPAATLSISPSNVAPGGTGTAAWTNILTPSVTDWIGLYQPGAADNAFISWEYTTGAASGSEPFNLASVALGTYQLRLFSNNGYTRLATSPNFSIGLAQKLHFIQVDHLNTPRAIYDDQQRLEWTWEQQEPFGVGAPDENPSGLGAFEMPLRFVGQYFDKETNLAYNFWRDYDPWTGRYIESDIVGLQSGLNTYLYAHADPLTYFDSDGLYPKKENGNRKPGFRQQDMVCTLPGRIGAAANANPCIKKCCVEHDKCYDKYKCNSSSWYGKWWSQCGACNMDAIICIIAARNRSRNSCGCGDSTEQGSNP